MTDAPISYQQEVRRKLIHLSSLWMPTAMCFLPRFPLATAFLILLILNLLVEHARAAGNPVITPVYDFFFGRMLRFQPKPGQWIVSGGPYVFASAAMSLFLFPSPVAAAAMTVMLLGDTAAALIGRKFGKHKTVNGKSLEGVAAFLLAGYAGAAVCLALCNMPGIFFLMAAPGVLLAAIAELFEKQIRLDDNFSIPLAMGGMLSLGWLFF
ncbi:MAG: phosphatidate cytidylyltransferase [Lentisphaeria bacterium]|nr:phosphatidate cytidylyltransferase [Lentisphaeria bacterium]